VRLLSSSQSGLAHGRNYRGNKKDSFLHVLLQHDKYHGLCVDIFADLNHETGKTQPSSSSIGNTGLVPM